MKRCQKVGVYESPELNAFATGPSKNNSLVAVSTGLLDRMNQDELEGVLGHEVAHIANGDMVTMSLVQGIVNAFVMFIASIITNIVINAMRRDDDDDSPGFGDFFLRQMIYSVISGLVGFLQCQSSSGSLVTVNLPSRPRWGSPCWTRKNDCRA